MMQDARRVRIIVALALTSFASSASMRVCDALLPRFSSDFAVGIHRAAALITGFSVAYGLMLVVFGPLGDRYGKVRVIVWGAALCSLWSLACALSPTFGWLLAARVLAGACAAAVIPLSMAWIGDTVPFARRQPVLATFILGQILGVGAGQVLGGIAADTIGWRTAFTLIATWFAVAALILHRLDAAEPVPPAGDAGETRWSAGLAEVLRDPWSRIVMTAALVEGAAVYAALAFTALHFHRRFGVSLTQAGAMAMAFGAGGLLYVAFARRIVAYLGELRVSLLGSVLMGCAFIAAGFAARLPWPVVAVLCAGIGYYLFHTTLQLQATQMVPRWRGAAIALFATAFFLGQALGVGIAGIVVERMGTAPVLAGCGLAIVLLGLAYARVGGPRMARARESE